MLGVLAREPVEVGAAGPTELVDRLVVVSDNEKVAVTGDEGLDQLRLRVVGVLVLVDHHVADSIRNATARSRLLAKEPLGVQDAIVEVEDAGAPVPLIEARIDARDVGVALEHDALRGVLTSLEAGRGPRRIRVWGDQLLFCRPDDVEERIHQVMRAQWIPEQLRTQFVEDRLDVQPPFGGVGDAQHWRDAEQPSPLTHNAERERVVVGERGIVGEPAVRPLHAFAHLVGSLAGVREDELPSGTDADRGEAVEPLDDDPGLAASRTREHQAWTVAVIDRDTLLVVEHRFGWGLGWGDHAHRIRFWAAPAT